MLSFQHYTRVERQNNLYISRTYDDAQCASQPLEWLCYYQFMSITGLCKTQFKKWLRQSVYHLSFNNTARTKSSTCKPKLEGAITMFKKAFWIWNSIYPFHEKVNKINSEYRDIFPILKRYHVKSSTKGLEINACEWVKIFLKVCFF